MGKMMKEYGYGGMSSGPLKKKKDGGQALFDALKAKGYKKMGGPKAAMETGMMKYGGSCGKVMKYNRANKSF